MEENLFDNIIPYSARPVVVVEEGEVEVVIEEYLFRFTIHEYSNGIVKIMLDTDTPESRKMLEKYGVSFNDETLDEVHGEEFCDEIFRIYSWSNLKGGNSCNWQTDEQIDYIEFD